MKTLRFVLAPIVALALPLMATSANAGIIVTIGKPSPTDLSKKPRATGNFGEKETGDRACTVSLDGKTNCPQVAQIDPMTGLPQGWLCRPMAPNQFYCDDSARGAGAVGDGGAGTFDDVDMESDVDTAGVDGVDGDEEIQNFGCGVGGGEGAFGIVAALGAIGVMATRRRSAGR